MSLAFYTNPHSRGAIVRWALEEIGCAYETRPVPYGPEMKSDAYRLINPMGKVPAIVHDGAVVTEVAAICAYLAEAFPDAGLAPTDEERAAYLRWLFFAAGPLEAAITNKAMGFAPTEEQGRMAGYGNFETAVGTIEQHLGAAPYVAGDRFTMADVYVGSHILWGLQFGTLPERDHFKAYAARLSGREALARAREKDAALAQEMGMANG
ncbi:glutathione S-transferase family protein [Sphingomicrobium nitratireducens]|uniref:glutathione S-transferase family protein n=1 Tax=Sphingomicrobium nitratireducens TaxID=2964666 RepID=UPI00223FA0C3|nr:glutathione S-transferase family protein [Sphingomicrobium nitratireducens]